ncbi:MAG: NAD-dependent malic enzyme, partial [Deltaproteobacteria bacterium]|nr:NAD-dependent malic enzyme [Deltaproteobacteria bacterium]
TLAGLVTHADLEKGQVYPDLCRIREVSAEIAAAVAEIAYAADLTSSPRPEGDLVEVMRSTMYDPHY